MTLSNGASDPVIYRRSHFLLVNVMCSTCWLPVLTIRVAIHSLDLAPWNRGLRTEIDFVLIVPDTGILCIEVKSHEKITFENDRWYPVEIKRSPCQSGLRCKPYFPQAA